ncbi:MAG: hypothetical protein WA323_10180 [Candidatus Nitrosopolaris sp.]
MITSFSNIKSLPDSDTKNPIWKKVIRFGDQPPVMVAVIHESIVQDLHINENTWFEEIPTSQGIFLKISPKIEVSYDSKISQCSESLGRSKIDKEQN